MEILKIFNNNVVAAKASNNTELILVGPGIGFQKKPGDQADKQKIRKRYILDSGERNRLYQLYDKTAFAYFEVSEQIFQKAVEQFGPRINNSVLLSLIDHISFAIDRIKRGVAVPNLLLAEIRIMYRDEYEFGRWAVEFINKQKGVSLPDDESGYIAMHIINTLHDDTQGMAVDILSIVKSVIQIIEDVYSLDLKEADIHLVRLNTHLKYLAQRILNEDMTGKNDKADSSLYNVLISKDDRMQTCLDRINAYLQESREVRLSKNEELYIMIHILKIADYFSPIQDLDE